MAFGWFRAFRSSRLANDDFATRATAFPNLFKKNENGLVMPRIEKCWGNGLHRLQNPFGKSADVVDSVDSTSALLSQNLVAGETSSS